MQNEVIGIRLLSSLEKVFVDEELKATEWNNGSMLANEVYSFQVAYSYNGKGRMLENVKVKVVSTLLKWITIRKVDLVASEMPCYKDHDDNVLRTAPGLYPDPLTPIDNRGITLLPAEWRSIWVTVNPYNQVKPGTYPIKIIFETELGEEIGSEIFTLSIISAKLPKQSLIHTEWFHSDCLATWYKVDIFSEEHWKLIDQYINTAVKHGINMILTPLFTPPLDTVIGGERPTVQLVDIEKLENTYKFRFEKLKRWIDICKANGIEYFEYSHFFTQWGALHAPKIMAYEGGELKRIFGWDTDAAGEKYKYFLSKFLPKLVNFIKQQGLEKYSYFHVSDEPGTLHIESYKNAAEIINEYLYEFPVMDALSDYKYYENGIVKNPIPATNHIEPFIENNVPNLWTYFCCSQYIDVANRFFNFPSARNRIIGIQMYKFDIVGFLQWGYNFWYSKYSIHPIDPYRVTDAGYAFPSGDAFIVYPGEDGPIESLRLEVFFDALQDMRALKLLEELIGREAVLEMLEEGLENPITFKQYPTDPKWILLKREQINRMIKQYSK